MKTVLSIAAFDSSGGAGLLQDTRAAGIAGCRLIAALTANTLQSDIGLEAIAPVEPSFLERQLHRMLMAFPVAAVKIGALCDVEQAGIVAGALSAFPRGRVVWDPVLAASGGGSFIPADRLADVIEALLPHVGLLTPNLPELSQLATAKGIGENNGDSPADCLARAYRCALFVKGGHDRGDLLHERLILPGQSHQWAKPKLNWVYSRGTGCLLSTFIACELAEGHPYIEAVQSATVRTEAYFSQLNERWQ